VCGECASLLRIINLTSNRERPPVLDDLTAAEVFYFACCYRCQIPLCWLTAGVGTAMLMATGCARQPRRHQHPPPVPQCRVPVLQLPSFG
jgi:hypothetical protein